MLAPVLGQGEALQVDGVDLLPVGQFLCWAQVSSGA